MSILSTKLFHDLRGGSVDERALYSQEVCSVKMLQSSISLWIRPTKGGRSLLTPFSKHCHPPSYWTKPAGFFTLRDTPGLSCYFSGHFRLQESAGGLPGSSPNATSASLDKYRMSGKCLPGTPPNLKTYFHTSLISREYPLDFLLFSFFKLKKYISLCLWILISSS